MTKKMERTDVAPKKVAMSLYLPKEIRVALRKRANEAIISVNTWITQAILEKMHREDKAK